MNNITHQEIINFLFIKEPEKMSTGVDHNLVDFEVSLDHSKIYVELVCYRYDRSQHESYASHVFFTISACEFTAYLMSLEKEIERPEKTYNSNGEELNPHTLIPIKDHVDFTNKKIL